MLTELCMLFYIWTHSLRFTVNRRISIVGFGLYGSIHGPTDYQVNIQVHFFLPTVYHLKYITGVILR